MRCSPSPIETFHATLDMEEASIAALLPHFNTYQYIHPMHVYTFSVALHAQSTRSDYLLATVHAFFSTFPSQNTLPSFHTCTIPSILLVYPPNPN
jgi:hypothetical protein